MTINAVLVGRGSAAGTQWTTSSGTTAVSGSTFVLAISYDAGMTGNTPTDSKSNTYTRIGTTLTTGNGDKVELWKCENGTGGSGHTASQTYIGNAFGVGHLIEITGATSSPTDVTTQGNDSSTPFTITSPTLNQANEIVITICAANQFVSGTNTYSSSNTTIISQESDGANFWTSAVSTLVVSSTTAVTPSFTVTQGSAAGLIIASFKAAGSAAAIYEVENSARPRPGRGPFSNGRYFVSDNTAYTTAAVNVTVALTGQAATFTAGSLAPSTTVALQGQGGTFAAGTVTPNTAGSLTGQSATLSAGLLTPSLSVPLSGQTATFASGTLIPGISIALTGQQAVFSAGTMSTSNDVTVSLTGQAASFTAGVLAPSITIALTGGAASFAAGTLIPTPTVGLSGAGGTFASGSLSPAIDTALTGLSASFTAGILGVVGDVTVALTGQRAQFTAGSLGVQAALADTHDGFEKRWPKTQVVSPKDLKKIQARLQGKKDKPKPVQIAKGPLSAPSVAKPVVKPPPQSPVVASPARIEKPAPVKVPVVAGPPFGVFGKPEVLQEQAEEEKIIGQYLQQEEERLQQLIGIAEDLLSQLR